MNCQKCRTPLKLDSSLQNLNPAAYDILVNSAGHNIEQVTSPRRSPYPRERASLYEKASQNAESPLYKRTIPPLRRGLQSSQISPTQANRHGLKDNPDMSFVMLTESQVTPPPSSQREQDAQSGLGKHSSGRALKESKQPLSIQMDSATRLFEILSARSDIDHPICVECTELLLSSLQSRLAVSVKERDAYISFLRDLKNNIPTPAEVSKAEAELASIQAAENKAFEELSKFEREKANLEGEILDLEDESRGLDQEEEDFWRSRNAFALTLSSFQEARDALNASYEHDAQQLERLQRTNVYNDTFCIGHDGDFGTINGLRLGRLPPPKHVEWTEINAAWGTTALLLETIAEKLGFAFRGYRIKPMGSSTHIERLEYSAANAEVMTNLL